jgi:predicted DNA-binding transcriptional regulator AlpA
MFSRQEGGVLRRVTNGVADCMSLPDGPLASSESPPPLLLTANQVAAMFGKSVRAWRAWDAEGVVPRPIRISRSTYWRHDEILAWIDAGCPRRQQWEARRQNSA